MKSKSNVTAYEYGLTASIVTYRTDPEELAKSIASCRSSNLAVGVTVVDNSPSWDLEPVCLSLGVNYIHAGRNAGFGAAQNIALRNSAPSKFHLVLNPDVQFEGAVLEELVSFLEANESVGLAMPRVLYPDGSTQNLCKRLPSPLDILAKRFSSGFLGRVFKKRLATFELRNLDMNRLLSVPYLSGCFMMFRKQVLRDAGGFDERYFMYFEDLDLSRRIHQRYATVYYPGVTIVHRHEKGSYKNKWLLLCGINSAIRYFNKWGWVVDPERDRINNAIGPLDLAVHGSAESRRRLVTEKGQVWACPRNVSE